MKSVRTPQPRFVRSPSAHASFAASIRSRYIVGSPWRWHPLNMVYRMDALQETETGEEAGTASLQQLWVQLQLQLQVFRHPEAAIRQISASMLNRLERQLAGGMLPAAAPAATNAGAPKGRDQANAPKPGDGHPVWRPSAFAGKNSPASVAPSRSAKSEQGTTRAAWSSPPDGSAGIAARPLASEGSGTDRQVLPEPGLRSAEPELRHRQPVKPGWQESLRPFDLAPSSDAAASKAGSGPVRDTGRPTRNSAESQAFQGPVRDTGRPTPDSAASKAVQGSVRDTDRATRGSAASKAVQGSVRDTSRPTPDSAEPQSDVTPRPGERSTASAGSTGQELNAPSNAAPSSSRQEREGAPKIGERDNPAADRLPERAIRANPLVPPGPNGLTGRKESERSSDARSGSAAVVQANDDDTERRSVGWPEASVSGASRRLAQPYRPHDGYGFLSNLWFGSALDSRLDKESISGGRAGHLSNGWLQAEDDNRSAFPHAGENGNRVTAELIGFGTERGERPQPNVRIAGRPYSWMMKHSAAGLPANGALNRYSLAETNHWYSTTVRMDWRAVGRLNPNDAPTGRIGKNDVFFTEPSPAARERLASRAPLISGSPALAFDPLTAHLPFNADVLSTRRAAGQRAQSAARVDVADEPAGFTLESAERSATQTQKAPRIAGNMPRFWASSQGSAVFWASANRLYPSGTAFSGIPYLLEPFNVAASLRSSERQQRHLSTTQPRNELIGATEYVMQANGTLLPATANVSGVSSFGAISEALTGWTPDVAPLFGTTPSDLSYRVLTPMQRTPSPEAESFGPTRQWKSLPIPTENAAHISRRSLEADQQAQAFYAPATLSPRYVIVNAGFEKYVIPADGVLARQAAAGPALQRRAVSGEAETRFSDHPAQRGQRSGNAASALQIRAFQALGAANKNIENTAPLLQFVYRTLWPEMVPDRRLLRDGSADGLTPIGAQAAGRNALAASRREQNVRGFHDNTDNGLPAQSGTGTQGASAGFPDHALPLNGAQATGSSLGTSRLPVVQALRTKSPESIEASIGLQSDFVRIFQGMGLRLAEGNTFFNLLKDGRSGEVAQLRSIPHYAASGTSLLYRTPSSFQADAIVSRSAAEQGAIASTTLRTHADTTQQSSAAEGSGSRSSSGKEANSGSTEGRQNAASRSNRSTSAALNSLLSAPAFLGDPGASVSFAGDSVFRRHFRAEAFASAVLATVGAETRPGTVRLGEDGPLASWAWGGNDRRLNRTEAARLASFEFELARDFGQPAFNSGDGSVDRNGLRFDAGRLIGTVLGNTIPFAGRSGLLTTRWHLNESNVYPVLESISTTLQYAFHAARMASEAGTGQTATRAARPNRGQENLQYGSDALRRESDLAQLLDAWRTGRPEAGFGVRQDTAGAIRTKQRPGVSWNGPGTARMPRGAEALPNAFLGERAALSLETSLSGAEYKSETAPIEPDPAAFRYTPYEVGEGWGQAALQYTLNGIQSGPVVMFMPQGRTLDTSVPLAGRLQRGQSSAVAMVRSVRLHHGEPAQLAQTMVSASDKHALGRMDSDNGRLIYATEASEAEPSGTRTQEGLGAGSVSAVKTGLQRSGKPYYEFPVTDLRLFERIASFMSAPENGLLRRLPFTGSAMFRQGGGMPLFSTAWLRENGERAIASLAGDPAGLALLGGALGPPQLSAWAQQAVVSRAGTFEAAAPALLIQRQTAAPLKESSVFGLFGSQSSRLPFFLAETGKRKQFQSEFGPNAATDNVPGTSGRRPTHTFRWLPSGVLQSISSGSAPYGSVGSHVLGGMALLLANDYRAGRMDAGWTSVSAELNKGPRKSFRSYGPWEKDNTPPVASTRTGAILRESGMTNETLDRLSGRTGQVRFVGSDVMDETAAYVQSADLTVRRPNSLVSQVNGAAGQEAASQANAASASQGAATTASAAPMVVLYGAARPARLITRRVDAAWPPAMTMHRSSAQMGARALSIRPATGFVQERTPDPANDYRSSAQQSGDGSVLFSGSSRSAKSMPIPEARTVWQRSSRQPDSDARQTRSADSRATGDPQPEPTSAVMRATAPFDAAQRSSLAHRATVGQLSGSVSDVPVQRVAAFGRVPGSQSGSESVWLQARMPIGPSPEALTPAQPPAKPENVPWTLSAPEAELEYRQPPASPRPPEAEPSPAAKSAAQREKVSPPAVTVPAGAAAGGLDIDKIVSRVYRELEKKFRFDQQKRGR